MPLKQDHLRNSLAASGQDSRALTAEGLGLDPDQGTKIPQAVWYSQKGWLGQITSAFCADSQCNITY